jgi:pimeloyl-ACP methyl ester carboxylesterase
MIRRIMLHLIFVLAGGTAASAAAQPPVPSLPDLRFAEVRAHEKFLGDRWSHMEAGSRDAPAIVALHGVGGNSADWRYQLHDLSDRFHVVAWYAPGYMLSDGLKEDAPGCRAYADALGDFLDALQLSRVHLVGNSFGSRVTQCFAMHYPARVLRIALLGAGIRPKGMPQATKDSVIVVRQRQIAGGGYIFGARVAALLGPEATPEVTDLVRNTMRATNPRGFMQGIKLGLADGYAPDEVAANVHIPVLLITGSQDPVNPAATNAAVLQRVTPNARLEIIERVGHVPHLEAPARVNHRLREFFGQ